MAPNTYWNIFILFFSLANILYILQKIFNLRKKGTLGYICINIDFWPAESRTFKVFWRKILISISGRICSSFALTY